MCSCAATEVSSPAGESALHRAVVPRFSPVTPSAIIRALVLRTQSPPSLNTRAGRYTSERSQGSRGFSTFPTEDFLPAVAICAQPQHSEERGKKKAKLSNGFGGSCQGFAWPSSYSEPPRSVSFFCSSPAPAKRGKKLPRGFIISTLRSSGTQKRGFPSATHKWA